MFSETRVRKKKRLTDPVKIIAFPNQDLRSKAGKAQSPSVKSAVKESLQQAIIAPEPKVLGAPSGKLRASQFSIKKMLEQKEEIIESGSDTRNLPHEPYSFDDLKMTWRKFAFVMKNEGQESIYNAMIKRDLKFIGEHEYLLEVDNPIQVEKFKAEESNLLMYIRKSLQNYSIKVSYEVTNNPDTDVKYQTGKEKFAALARKNPNLHSLKNTFNLDIEY